VPAVRDHVGVIPADDPLAAGDLRGWGLQLLRVLRRSGRPLLVLHAACLLPAGLLAVPLARLGGTVGVVAAGLLVGGAAAWAQAASVRLAVLEAAGRPTAVSTAFADARAAVPQLLGWSALAALLTAAGLPLAVLPGLYVAAVATAALPGVVVVERAGLGRAAALVNRRLAGTAARFAVGLFAAAFYGAVVGTVVAAVPAPVDDAVRALAALPLTLAGTAFAVVTYAGLRRAVDGRGTADLAAGIEAGPAG
jgi:hypothetical protein